MFCRNCGANLPDGASFCATCGTAQGAVTAAPKQQSPMMANFLSVLKGIFKNPVATVGKAAKSTSHEWSLFAGACVLFYALSTAVVGIEMYGKYTPFFGMFGIAILVGAVSYFATAFGLWLLVAKLFKKNASLVGALNLVAVASLPLAAIHLLNMLFGLIYGPLAMAFFIIALIMTVVLLYEGCQKFDTLAGAPFYGFCIVVAAAILVTFLAGLLYNPVFKKGYTKNYTKDMLGGYGDLFGGYGDMLGSYDYSDLF